MELTGNVSGLINLGGGGGGSTVEVTPIVTSGEHIADIDVDGVTSELYAPEAAEPTEVEVIQVLTTGTKIATIGVDGVDVDLYAPEGGGSIIDYSTTEQETGDKWIDGKKRYRRTINLGNISFGGFDYDLRNTYGIDFDKLWVDLNGSYFIDSSTGLQVPFGYGYPNLNVPVGWLHTANGIHVQVGGNYNGKVTNLTVTFIYTKAN